MELTHAFTVPASVEETWDAFNDIESVAECFPGATVTSVEAEEFKGSAKVKLGPIALTYSGQGKFLDKDESGRRMVIEAKGKDKRGNGTAGATVTASFTEAAGGGTSVEVVTDLQITGKPAQFGRGVIQDVSDKLLQQFVSCLESRVGAPEAAAAPAAEAPAAAPAAEAAPAAAGAEAPAAAEEEAGAAVGAGRHVAEAPAAEPRAEHVAPESVAATQRSAGTRHDTLTEARERGSAEALDLGTTVLPILLKAYWKQVAGAVLALLVLRRLFRRRS